MMTVLSFKEEREGGACTDLQANPSNFIIDGKSDRTDPHQVINRVDRDDTKGFSECEEVTKDEGTPFNG